MQGGKTWSRLKAKGLVEIVKRDGASTTAVIKLKEMLGNWLKKHICNVNTHLRGCLKVHQFQLFPEFFT